MASISFGVARSFRQSSTTAAALRVISSPSDAVRTFILHRLVPSGACRSLFSSTRCSDRLTFKKRRVRTHFEGQVLLTHPARLTRSTSFRITYELGSVSGALLPAPLILWSTRIGSPPSSTSRGGPYLIRPPDTIARPSTARNPRPTGPRDPEALRCRGAFWVDLEGAFPRLTLTGSFPVVPTLSSHYPAGTEGLPERYPRPMAALRRCVRPRQHRGPRSSLRFPTHDLQRGFAHAGAAGTSGRHEQPTQLPTTCIRAGLSTSMCARTSDRLAARTNQCRQRSALDAALRVTRAALCTWNGPAPAERARWSVARVV
jgi:hypothetical protein